MFKWIKRKWSLYKEIKELRKIAKEIGNLTGEDLHYFKIDGHKVMMFWSSLSMLRQIAMTPETYDPNDCKIMHYEDYSISLINGGYFDDSLEDRPVARQKIKDALSIYLKDCKLSDSIDKGKTEKILDRLNTERNKQ